MTLKRRTFIASALALLILSSVATGAAETDHALEYNVKAAFLYNFSKFVDWPADAFDSADSPVVFGVLGPDPFGSVLNGLEEKKVKNRRVEVRRYEDFGPQVDCHVLFIGFEDPGRVETVLQALDDRPVLTVSDARGPDDGGIIRFVIRNNKVNFHIDGGAAERSRLKMSSRLLKLSVSAPAEARVLEK